MRLRVIAVLENDLGEPMLGYTRDEIIFPEGGEDGPDAEKTALDVSGKVLDTVDEAKDSLSKQIAGLHRILGA